MALKSIKDGTIADAYLALLADRGVDYFFGNAGTDFAPIIEAFAKAAATGTPVPKPMLVPHENVAIHMALGYYVVTGRPQVVMVHVNVGAANAMCGLINAAKGNLPVLFSSGRTPFTETGDQAGRRNREIHWPQEMFDQGSMMREFVKWDYELKSGDVLETAVDRALNIAMSEPRGPVYMALPREPLAKQVAEFTYESPTRHRTPSAPHPDAAAIDEAAAMLAGAENPLIITADLGRESAAVPELAALSEKFALPVVQRKPHFMSLPTDHSMHMGYDSDPYLESADVILVMDCDVPWIPDTLAPGRDCKVIHIGSDPLFSTYPIRGYTCDLAVTGLASASLKALNEAMETHMKSANGSLDARRKRIAEEHARLREGWRGSLEAAKESSSIQPALIGHCIDQVKGDDSIVVKEASIPWEQMNFTQPGAAFSGGAGGGLGYGLGMALGAKLAAPERLVFCLQGDGAYMYGNPVPSHYVANAEKLPIVTIIFNNEHWGAVKRNTRAMYPDGYAARSNREPLTFFEPGVQYEHAVQVAGGYGERVENPADLPGAMERAVDSAVNDGRQALLNVVCSQTSGGGTI